VSVRYQRRVPIPARADADASIPVRADPAANVVRCSRR